MAQKPFINQPQRLTESLLINLEQRLSIGCTIEVACGSVGITRQTFYNWKRASAEWCALGDANPRLPVPIEIVPILTFLTRITRAQANAAAVATAAVYSGLIEHRTVEMEPYTHYETRFYEGKDGKQVQYVHQETRLRPVEHIRPPDWRAGIEFLRRRHPDDWNPPSKVEVSFEQKAVLYIRAGEVQFEDMAEEFGMERAKLLFEMAGVPVPRFSEDILSEQDE